MRHNLTQSLLASLFNIAQATISRTITALTPVLAESLADFSPTTDQARQAARSSVILIDGTLCPAWSWRHRNELYNGKHRTTGHAITVISTLDGDPVFVSDHHEGRTHEKPWPPHHN